jgi:flagella synthesis protein FlgN
MAETLGNLLARRIGDEIALLRDFVAVLKREQEALTADDADEISATSQAKIALLHKLGQIANERNFALAREGFAADRAGLDAFMARHVDSGALVQLRDRLITVAGEADALNRINGKLIRLRMVHNQKSLAFLLEAGDGSSTYGRDGRSCLGGNPVGRRLTTA